MFSIYEAYFFTAFENERKTTTTTITHFQRFSYNFVSLMWIYKESLLSMNCKRARYQRKSPQNSQIKTKNNKSNSVCEHCVCAIALWWKAIIFLLWWLGKKSEYDSSRFCTHKHVLSRNYQHTQRENVSQISRPILTRPTIAMQFSHKHLLALPIDHYFFFHSESLEGIPFKFKHAFAFDQSQNSIDLLCACCFVLHLQWETENRLNDL